MTKYILNRTLLILFIISIYIGLLFIISTRLIYLFKSRYKVSKIRWQPDRNHTSHNFNFEKYFIQIFSYIWQKIKFYRDQSMQSKSSWCDKPHISSSSSSISVGRIRCCDCSSVPALAEWGTPWWWELEYWFLIIGPLEMLGVDPNTVGTCKLDLAFCNLARLMRGPAKD